MHPTLLSNLETIDPGSEFSTSLPRIVSSSGRVYYAKIGDNVEAEQYHGEAESLSAIQLASPGLAPNVLSTGTDESGSPWMISEYMDLSPGVNIDLARRLATELHVYRPTTGKFGFQRPTYCGVTRLKHGWFDTWEDMFREMIGQLREGLKMKGRGSDIADSSLNIMTK